MSVPYSDTLLRYNTEINTIIADLVMIYNLISTLSERYESKRPTQDYMNRMMFLEYGQKKQHQFKGAKTKLDKIGRQDAAGDHPRYRGNYQNKLGKAQGKIERQYSWYHKGKYQEMMFVKCPPNGELFHRVRKTLADNNLKILR